MSKILLTALTAAGLLTGCESTYLVDSKDLGGKTSYETTCGNPVVQEGIAPVVTPIILKVGEVAISWVLDEVTDAVKSDLDEHSEAYALLGKYQCDISQFDQAKRKPSYVKWIIRSGKDETKIDLFTSMAYASIDKLNSDKAKRENEKNPFTEKELKEFEEGIKSELEKINSGSTFDPFAIDLKLLVPNNGAAWKAFGEAEGEGLNNAEIVFTLKWVTLNYSLGKYESHEVFDGGIGSIEFKDGKLQDRENSTIVGYEGFTELKFTIPSPPTKHSDDFNGELNTYQIQRPVIGISIIDTSISTEAKQKLYDALNDNKDSWAEKLNDELKKKVEGES